MYTLILFLSVVIIISAFPTDDIFTAFASDEDGPIQFDSPLVGVKRSEGFFLERTLPADSPLVAFAPSKKNKRTRSRMIQRRTKSTASQPKSLDLILPPPMEKSSVRRASQLKKTHSQPSEYCTANSALYLKYCFNMSVDRPPALRTRLYDFCPYYENTCMQ